MTAYQNATLNSDLTTPPTLDYGAIGNGRVLALISPSSAIDWLCLPRFDSPSVFGRLLDREKGGTFRFLVEDQEIRGNLSYVPNTNVLVTRFEHKDTCWELLDFAPRIPEGLTVLAPIKIVRLLRPIKGRPRLRVDFDPRPDYARAKVQLMQTTCGIEIVGGNIPLTLIANIPIPYILNKQEFLLNQPIFFIFSHKYREGLPNLIGVQQDLDLTIAGWRAWVKTCALPTFAPKEVLRSALCLKIGRAHV